MIYEIQLNKIGDYGTIAICDPKTWEIKRVMAGEIWELAQVFGGG